MKTTIIAALLLLTLAHVVVLVVAPKPTADDTITCDAANPAVVKHDLFAPSTRLNISVTAGCTSVSIKDASLFNVNFVTPIVASGVEIVILRLQCTGTEDGNSTTCIHFEKEIDSAKSISISHVHVVYTASLYGLKKATIAAVLFSSYVTNVGVNNNVVALPESSGVPSIDITDCSLVLEKLGVGRDNILNYYFQPTTVRFDGPVNKTRHIRIANATIRLTNSSFFRDLFAETYPHVVQAAGDFASIGRVELRNLFLVNQAHCMITGMEIVSFETAALVDIDEFRVDNVTMVHMLHSGLDYRGRGGGYVIKIGRGIRRVKQIVVSRVIFVSTHRLVSDTRFSGFSTVEIFACYSPAALGPSIFAEPGTTIVVERVEVHQHYFGFDLMWKRSIHDGRAVSWADVRASLDLHWNPLLEQFGDALQRGVDFASGGWSLLESVGALVPLLYQSTSVTVVNLFDIYQQPVAAAVGSSGGGLNVSVSEVTVSLFANTSIRHGLMNVRLRRGNAPNVTVSRLAVSVRKCRYFVGLLDNNFEIANRGNSLALRPGLMLDEGAVSFAYENQVRAANFDGRIRVDPDSSNHNNDDTLLVIEEVHVYVNLSLTLSHLEAQFLYSPTNLMLLPDHAVVLRHCGIWLQLRSVQVAFYAAHLTVIQLHRTVLSSLAADNVSINFVRGTKSASRSECRIVHFESVWDQSASVLGGLILDKCSVRVPPAISARDLRPGEVPALVTAIGSQFRASLLEVRSDLNISSSNSNVISQFALQHNSIIVSDLDNVSFLEQIDGYVFFARTDKFFVDGRDAYFVSDEALDAAVAASPQECAAVLSFHNNSIQLRNVPSITVIQVAIGEFHEVATSPRTNFSATQNFVALDSIAAVAGSGAGSGSVQISNYGVFYCATAQLRTSEVFPLLIADNTVVTRNMSMLSSGPVASTLFYDIQLLKLSLPFPSHTVIARNRVLSQSLQRSSSSGQPVVRALRHFVGMTFLRLRLLPQSLWAPYTAKAAANVDVVVRDNIFVHTVVAPVADGEYVGAPCGFVVSDSFRDLSMSGTFNFANNAAEVVNALGPFQQQQQRQQQSFAHNFSLLLLQPTHSIAKRRLSTDVAAPSVLIFSKNTHVNWTLVSFAVEPPWGEPWTPVPASAVDLNRSSSWTFRGCGRGDVALSASQRRDLERFIAPTAASLVFDCTDTKTSTRAPTKTKRITSTRTAADSESLSLPDTRSASSSNTRIATPSHTGDNISQTATQSADSASISQHITESSTHNTATHSKTFHIVTFLGLDPETAAAMSVSAQSVSAVASLAASVPTAAMSLSRGLSVLQLIGCPKFNPVGRRWITVDPGFSYSLLVGTAMGNEVGAYYRAGAVGFLLLMALAAIASLVLRARPQLVPEFVVARDGEEQDQQHEQEQEMQEIMDTREQARRQRKQEIERLKREKLEKSLRAAKAKAEQLPVGTKLPHLLLFAMAPFLGSFASIAGTLATTDDPIDLALGVLPLLLLAAGGLWCGKKIYEGTQVVEVSANKKDDKSKSKDSKSKDSKKKHRHYDKKDRDRHEKKNDSNSKTISIAPYHIVQSFVARIDDTVVATRLQITAERILRSGFGRWFLVGNFVWRRHSHAPDDADRSLMFSMARFFTQLHGPVHKVTAFGEAAGVDVSSSTQERYAALYTVISGAAAIIVGVLQGVSLGMDNENSICKTAITVNAVINILMFMLTIWLRPFIVPARNFFISLIEACCTATAVTVWVVADEIDDGSAVAAVLASQLVVLAGATLPSLFLLLSKLTARVCIAVGKVAVVPADVYWSRFGAASDDVDGFSSPSHGVDEPLLLDGEICSSPVSARGRAATGPAPAPPPTTPVTTARRIIVCRKIITRVRRPQQQPPSAAAAAAVSEGEAEDVEATTAQQAATPKLDGSDDDETEEHEEGEEDEEV